MKGCTVNLNYPDLDYTDFSDYPDLLPWSQFFMSINKSYFVSVAELFSFKLCDETVRTETCPLHSTNLNLFLSRTQHI